MFENMDNAFDNAGNLWRGLLRRAVAVFVGHGKQAFDITDDAFDFQDRLEEFNEIGQNMEHDFGDYNK